MSPDMPEPDLFRQCVAAFPSWLIYAVGAMAPLSIAGVAAHMNAWIKQPAAGSLWLIIRKPLSMLAGSYGWARAAADETLPEWWAANSASFFTWLVSKASDAVLAEVAKRIAEQQANTDPAAPAAPQPPQEGQ